MKNIFPQRLTELLQENNISKRSFSKEIGVSAASISDWSNGNVQPSAESIYLIANFFGVSTDYLLGLEDDFGVKTELTTTKKDISDKDYLENADKQFRDFAKLYTVMTEIQKAQVLGYIVGLLEQSGVNVATILGR